jgi:transposase
MGEQNENLSVETTEAAPVATETRERKNYSRDEFIKIWYGSNSAKEAGEKMGMDAATASSTASKYRRDGWVLKAMPKGGGVKLDPDKTYALLVELTGKTVEELKAEGEKQKNAPKKAKTAKAAG